MIDKFAKKLNRENIGFTTNSAGITQIQKHEPQLIPAPYSKNMKWIMDPNIKPKTLKFLEENITENLCDLWSGKGFIDITQ